MGDVHITSNADRAKTDNQNNILESTGLYDDGC